MWKDRNYGVTPCGLETDCRVFFFWGIDLCLSFGRFIIRTYRARLLRLDMSRCLGCKVER